MKVIVAGCRNFEDTLVVHKAIEQSGFSITEIISGNCSGVDVRGETYAKAAGIDLTIMPANWRLYGKAAGPVRNERMATYASSDKSRKGGLIAIWDGKSKGTKSMIDLAVKYNLKVFIYRIDQQ